jgi:hypothetical protein
LDQPLEPTDTPASGANVSGFNKRHQERQIGDVADDVETELEPEPKQRRVRPTRWAHEASSSILMSETGAQDPAGTASDHGPALQVVPAQPDKAQKELEQQQKADILHSMFLFAWDFTPDENDALKASFSSAFRRGKPLDEVIEKVASFSSFLSSFAELRYLQAEGSRKASAPASMIIVPRGNDRRYDAETSKGVAGRSG